MVSLVAYFRNAEHMEWNLNWKTYFISLIIKHDIEDHSEKKTTKQSCDKVQYKKVKTSSLFEEKVAGRKNNSNENVSKDTVSIH